MGYEHRLIGGGWGGLSVQAYGLYLLVVAQEQKKSVTFPTVLESKQSEQALSPEDGNFFSYSAHFGAHRPVLLNVSVVFYPRHISLL